MPQDRLRNQCASTSRKLSDLSDFEYRVWDQYQLSADDYGIMPAEAIRIQADNLALRARHTEADVQNALERLLALGLVLAYEHQGRRYFCDPLWQFYQHQQYHKHTLNPAPPDEVLERCHPLTQVLFLQCFSKTNERFDTRRVKASDDYKKRLEKYKTFLGGSGGAGALTLSTNANQITETEDARETHQLAPALGHATRFQRRTPVGRSNGVCAGALPLEHGMHAYCHGPGRCVHQSIHDIFAAELSTVFGDDLGRASDALLAWYPLVLDAHPPGVPLGDAFKFWRPKLETKWPSTVLDATLPELSAKTARMFHAINQTRN